MRKLDGENLGANRIKLGFGKSMPTMCVWLDGIVDTVSEKFLSRTFSRYGPVSFAAIDREKGHALVYFDSLECAQHAVAEMRGRVLGGKKLQVLCPFCTAFYPEKDASKNLCRPALLVRRSNSGGRFVHFVFHGVWCLPDTRPVDWILCVTFLDWTRTSAFG